MKHILTLTFISVLLFGCGNSQADKKTSDDSIHIYPTVSYLKIKLDNGKLPTNPYILEFTNGKKKIIFCGTNHPNPNDIENPMFSKIEDKFFSSKPNICINEGGETSQKKYTSKKDALLKNGEIGLIKVLADSLKLNCVNGDMNEAYEFKELLKKYSVEEFITYVSNERIMWEIKDKNITELKDIEKEYKKFIQEYIIKRGQVNLTENQKSFDFFKTNFEKILGRPFEINRPEPSNPFEPKGKLNEISRFSKQIRDQNLMRTIDNLLDKNDKVFIVFGGWHLLACKPGLDKIINRKRN